MNLKILVLIITSLTLSGCASTNSFSIRPDLEQSLTVSKVGVVGLPASEMTGKFQAVNVEMPSVTDEQSVRLFLEENNVVSLIVVKVGEKTEYRTKKSATAAKVGLFALNLALSVVSRSAIGIGQDHSSLTQIPVKVVTTSVVMYGQDGKRILSKTVVKESSDPVTTSHIAADSLKELLTLG